MHDTEDSFGCLVVGGSGELGRHIVRALHDEGATIGLTYHQNAEAAAQLCQQIPGVISAPADGRDLDSLTTAIDSLIAQLPPIRSCVHSASIFLTPGDRVPEDATQHMEDVSGAGWDELMSLNVKSAYFACQRIMPAMRRSGGGNVVLVGSISGTRPLPSPVHYAASKTALEGMARAMAKELGNDNIRVNVIEPGILEAGISRTLPSHLIAQYEKHCSLRRVGRMDEVASVVAWMAAANTYVSGQAILVDGAL
jgi:NAD(P)-dependent dehydrogenase (short-subunit alcohol dehydrogenase family)